MNPRISMTFASLKNAFLAAAVAIVAAGCGASAGSPAASIRSSQTAIVGAAGGTLSTGAVTVSIPAGALREDRQIVLHEAEPRHAGGVARVELEPNDLPLAARAVVVVRVDDRNGRVKMSDDSGQLVQVEVEDPNHHTFKTVEDRLGAIEVEVEHGRVCSTACAANEECDDGVCKPHVEDAGAATCSTPCASGLECDDGACKPHGGADDAAPGAAPGAPAACTPACASGLECDDGICKPHKS
ncbi:MAG TPA: hypothetical protein VFP65_11895 [Anaeromyxobacteraceae bacterium]|nr:hypothetical protein [Anaeromyxobacteraceae bacterium]